MGKKVMVCVLTALLACICVLMPGSSVVNKLLGTRIAIANAKSIEGYEFKANRNFYYQNDGYWQTKGFAYQFEESDFSVTGFTT